MAAGYPRPFHFPFSIPPCIRSLIRDMQLLSRIDTVTCSQIVLLVLDSSKTQGSMTGQEERDVFFARLFGLTSVIQSGLLLRETTLPSSSTAASDLEGYTEVITELLALGEKKSWLRESAWWSIGLAADALAASAVSWKGEAVDATISAIYSETKAWTPEKVALTLKLQAAYPSREWKQLLAPTFKNPDLLSTGNLLTLARILKVRYLGASQNGVFSHITLTPRVLCRNPMRTRTRRQMCRNRAHGSRSCTSSGTCSSINSSPRTVALARPKAPSQNFSGSSLMVCGLTPPLPRFCSR